MIDDYEAALEMKLEAFENLVETWYQRAETNETNWKIIQCDKMRKKIQDAEDAEKKPLPFSQFKTYDE